MSNTDNNGEKEKTRRDRFAGWIFDVVIGWASPTYDPNSGPPVGNDQPPKSLYLPNEDWVDGFGLHYNDDEYEIVVENGELGLERVGYE